MDKLDSTVLTRGLDGIASLVALAMWHERNGDVTASRRALAAIAEAADSFCGFIDGLAGADVNASPPLMRLADALDAFEDRILARQQHPEAARDTMHCDDCRLWACFGTAGDCRCHDLCER